MSSDEPKFTIKAYYPYAERFGALHAFPEKGNPREAVLEQLRTIAKEEDGFWETGKCSGTMYSGDHALYDFIGQVFGLFGHVNALQRDICPSQTRFEAEIIAMTLDLLHGSAASGSGPDEQACGVATTGGSESILSSILAHREMMRAERGIDRPEIIIPETAHVAHEKAADYFGVKVVRAPVLNDTMGVDVGFVADKITPNTIMLVGSAGNYPYGTVDPVSDLSDLAVKHDIGLHIDGCLGGFILPWGEMLGYDIPVFDYRLPGVTSISADTHKFGYGPKGTSVITYRSKKIRRYQYFLRPAWRGGKYASPGISGSRSGGLHAATWAVMTSLGKEGYLARAKKIFETALGMRDVIGRHTELRIMGKPTFCFSFTSDVFDIYHLNDFMRDRGWRFNGQQFPSAIHMCVTGPQTRPGIVDAFARDIADAIPYALDPPHNVPRSGALYGGRGANASLDDLDLADLDRIFAAYLDSILEQPAD